MIAPNATRHRSDFLLQESCFDSKPNKERSGPKNSPDLCAVICTCADETKRSAAAILDRPLISANGDIPVEMAAVHS
jgi:hypothetical protein